MLPDPCFALHGLGRHKQYHAEVGLPAGRQLLQGFAKAPYRHGIASPGAEVGMFLLYLADIKMKR